MCNFVSHRLACFVFLNRAGKYAKMPTALLLPVSHRVPLYQGYLKYACHLCSFSCIYLTGFNRCVLSNSFRRDSGEATVMTHLESENCSAFELQRTLERTPHPIMSPLPPQEESRVKRGSDSPELPHWLSGRVKHPKLRLLIACECSCRRSELKWKWP